jgi:hypothetical protein
MNQQQEFMNETFHTIVQPITALRMGVELGLCKEMTAAETRRTLTDCLCLIDRLMHDLRVFREIACLDEQPPLHPCDGQKLLEISAGDMASVAHDCGVTIQLNTNAALIECNEPMFQRAIFVLLDEMIAQATCGSEISVDLRPCGDEFHLDLRPGLPPGPRRKLCRKLMQFAGAGTINFTSECTSFTFLKSGYRHSSTISSTDKEFLISSEAHSGNGMGENI